MGGGLLWAAAIAAAFLAVLFAGLWWSGRGEVKDLTEDLGENEARNAKLAGRLKACESALARAQGEVRGLRYRIDKAPAISPEPRPASHRAPEPVTQVLPARTAVDMPMRTEVLAAIP